MAGTASNPISLDDEENIGGKEEVETNKKVSKKDKDEDGSGDEDSDVPDDADKKMKKEGKIKGKDQEGKDGSASEKGATSGDYTEEEPTSEVESETVAEVGSGLTYPVLIIGVLGALFAIIYALRPTATTTATHNYRSVDKFQEKIDEMKSDFPQQYTVYLNMLSNGGKKHLKKIHSEEKEELRPSAYLIAGYAGAGQSLKCFVSRLADAFTDGHQSLDSNDFAGSGEKNKQDLLESIKSKLGGDNKLLVVHDIEKLDFNVAQLFMSFADSHNTVASYPQSLILFTTELPFAFESSGGRVADEGKAGNHFKNVVWKDAHPDRSAPLWSRIGDGLTLIRGEEELPKC